MKLDRDILRKLPLALRVEIEENALRKPLTQSELAIEQRQILREIRKHTKPGERTDLTSGKTSPEVPEPEVRAADIVGKLFGESRKQVERRQAILMAAEADPEEFGHLITAMDKSGKVNAPFRRLKVTQQAKILRDEVPPLPMRGPYRAGVIDIPHAYEPHDDSPTRGVLDYPTLSIARVCALGINSLMHKDSVLFYWVTNFILALGLHLEPLTTWGFTPKTVITWPKPRHTFKAHWARGQTEHMILAVRGNPVIDLTDAHLSTLLQGPFHLVRKRQHSAKPREAYDFVESLVPAPRYADLFSRYRHNAKWDVHGDEAPMLTVKKEDDAA